MQVARPRPSSIVVRVFGTPYNFVKILPFNTDKWDSLTASLKLEAGLVVNANTFAQSMLADNIRKFALGDADLEDWAKEMEIGKCYTGIQHTFVCGKEALLIFD